MKRWSLFAVSTVLSLTVGLTGCSPPAQVEHYVSPKIQGEAQRINLDEVQKAFWDTKGKDFNSWMAAFEKKVNEIYDGKDVVSIDATRQSGRLVVTGYINKVNKEGFQPGDEKLFSIEQTGEAVNSEMPYRVAGQDGRTYYEGHHSFLDNPILQMMLVSHMMGGWGGRYYTPAPRVVVLQQSRDTFRQSPQFGQQQQANKGFFSRFNQKSAGGELESRNKFGSSTPFSSENGLDKRRQFGGSAPTPAPETSSGWGGRRSSGFGASEPSSSGFGGFGGMRRGGGWGRRRR